MKLLFVYKHYQFDPTLHAMLRWLPRQGVEVEFLEFSSRDRGQTESTGVHPRLKSVLESARPTHLLMWNSLLNSDEARFCLDAGVRLSSMANSFACFHSGHIPSQRRFFEFLRLLDNYFVPNQQHEPILREQGVRARAIPFFYDPDFYRPLSPWKRLFGLKRIPVLFIGALSEPAAVNRRKVVEELARHTTVHVFTYRNPRIPNVTWHRPQSRPWVLNWWTNLSNLVLNIEDVGPAYSPAVLNAVGTDHFVDYRFQRFFHGNHVFQAMAAGSVVFSEWSEELTAFCQDGRDTLVWRDLPEAVEKLRWATANPDALSGIRDAAIEVAKRHSAPVRIRSILESMSQDLP